MTGTLKTVVTVAVLFLAGVAAVMGVKVARTYFSGASGADQPTNVRILTDSSSATISWQSSKKSMGVVEYGANQANLLLRAPEVTPTTTHRVVISPLKTGTTYYFRIRVGNSVYDNNGIPYSFHTKEGPAGLLNPSATPSPSQAASPSGAALPAQLVTKCLVSDFKQAFGTHNKAYDFDGNGIVNTQDWLKCLQKYPQK